MNNLVLLLSRQTRSAAFWFEFTGKMQVCASVGACVCVCVCVFVGVASD